VPATIAAFSKGIFGAATYSTNQRNKAGGTCHLSVINGHSKKEKKAIKTVLVAGT
jgi:hypothetical protein